VDLYYEISGNQTDGARDYQEDAFLTTYLDDIDGKPKASALVIMADGMGGHAAGNIASNLVVSTFNKSFTGEFGKRDVATILRSCLDNANNALKESIRETPALDGMGCTMVAAALAQGKLWWVSVGDSHLYVIRERELDKCNEDHSYGGYLDRMKGQGMDVEPEAGLSRKMLMSAMTGDETAEIDCPDQPMELKSGDRLIVASDGLDTLSEGSILQVSARASSAKECVEALLKAVEDANKPRQDNTTVLVVDVMERGAPEPSPPPRDPADVTQPVDKAADTDVAIPDLTTQADVTTTFIDEDVEPKGSKKGLIIGLLVVILLALLGGGAWFYLTQMSSPTVVSDDADGVVIDANDDDDEVADTEDDAAATDEIADDTSTDGDAADDDASDDDDGTGSDTDATDTASVNPADREFTDALASGGTAPRMIRIPGGKFLMGARGFNANQNELPQHDVVVLPFAVSKYEISISEYEQFAKVSGRALPKDLGRNKDTYPVVFVTWEDALAYTKWLSEQTGEKYRLPSEGEWEYAARAGGATLYYWGNELGEENAHCADCESGLDARSPTKFGRFEPNAFGLHDMAGNVQEWVHDCYKNTYYGAPNDASVWEHGECTYRVTRGGAFDTPGTSIRASARNKRRPTTPYDSVGIRLVRDLNI
jgi:formylglycine-generating enzyme required for sulfatase activity/serine/threonine protein phosphatase PrpC